jgi:hypothetical protein
LKLEITQLKKRENTCHLVASFPRLLPASFVTAALYYIDCFSLLHASPRPRLLLSSVALISCIRVAQGDEEARHSFQVLENIQETFSIIRESFLEPSKTFLELSKTIFSHFEKFQIYSLLTRNACCHRKKPNGSPQPPPAHETRLNG